MASALIKKIEEDFLSCCICFDEMTDPIGLPCLHGFCFKCLDDWSKASQQHKTHLICPACTKPALIPKDGVRGFPSHFLAKNLKETVHMEFKDSEQPRYHSLCIVCGKKPKVHCVDCKKSLCNPCHRNHDTFTKDHMVVTIEKLKSGGITHALEGRFCAVHEEQLKYYCETEKKCICQDCVTLNTCHIAHRRVTLKEAASKQVSDIDELVKKCDVTKKHMQDDVEGAKTVVKVLSQAKKQAINDLDDVTKERVRRVEEAVKKRKDDVSKLEKDRLKEIREKVKKLMLNVNHIEEACKQGVAVIKSDSDYTITHEYQSLIKKLSSFAHLKTETVVDDSLGYLKFEATAIPTIPLFVGHVMHRKHWRCCGQFSTLQLSKLHGVTINQDGYLAVSSWEKCVKLYTKTGHVRCSISDSEGVVDIGVTPDNRFVFSARDQECIQFRDSRGNRLSTAAILDINDKASFVNSVAVDGKGRIIVGQSNNTISIHHSDGSPISKFATKFTPLRLAVTSGGDIVSSFYDKELRDYKGLQKMDYSGDNVTIISPPGDVITWVPAYVCCSQHGEIFVVNRVNGDPTGVYRYTAEGVFLDCVTTDVRKPTGIALSKGGMELFVAEYDGGIKMFVRE